MRGVCEWKFVQKIEMKYNAVGINKDEVICHDTCKSNPPYPASPTKGHINENPPKSKKASSRDNLRTTRASTINRTSSSPSVFPSGLPSFSCWAAVGGVMSMTGTVEREGEGLGEGGFSSGEGTGTGTGAGTGNGANIGMDVDAVLLLDIVVVALGIGTRPGSIVTCNDSSPETSSAEVRASIGVWVKWVWGRW